MPEPVQVTIDWTKVGRPPSVTLDKGAFAVLATADTEAIRNETFNGSDHLVIPVVALVEGVLQPGNSAVPELALASEFGRHPSGWDGSPVLLSHPRNSEGVQVPATSPEIMENDVFGTLFNTKLDGSKLKTEAWIDLDRVNELGGEAQETVSRIQSGDLVEISTGLFSSIERITGTFNDEEFNGIWRNVVPDHLALLPEGVRGACSIDDGCGTPRTNQAVQCASRCGTCSECVKALASQTTGLADGHSHTYDDSTGGTTSIVNGHSHTYSVSANSTGVTNGHSHNLPEIVQESAAHPKKRKKGKRAMTTENTETTDDPALGVTNAEGSNAAASNQPAQPEPVVPNTSGLATFRAPAAQFDFGDNVVRFEGDPGVVNTPEQPLKWYEKLVKYLTFRSDDDNLSDRDVRSALQAALDTDPDNFADVIAVFDGEFVYSQGFSGTFLRRSFSIGEDGTVTLGGETEQVRPETRFVPVNVVEDSTMTVAERVDALIGNERTKFTDKSKDWLLTLSEDQLTSMEPTEVTEETPTGETQITVSTQVAPVETKTVVELTATTEETEVTPEKFLEQAPPEMREVLAEGLKMHRQRKDAIVKGLIANSRCEFSEDDLNAMDLVALERLAKLSNMPNFAGQGGGTTVTTNEESDDQAPAPPVAFPLKQSAAA